MRTGAKYSIGDKCKIVRYGHLFWENTNISNSYKTKEYFPIIYEEKGICFMDARPDLVGKECLICYFTESQNKFMYSVTFDGQNQVSWFTEDQLELITSNPNTLNQK